MTLEFLKPKPDDNQPANLFQLSFLAAVPQEVSKPNEIVRPQQSGNCPPSPDFEKLIDLASRQAYEPALLGDIQLLKHQFDCQIHSTDDAISMASSVLTKKIDPYSVVLSKRQAEKLDQQFSGDDIGVGITLANHEPGVHQAQPLKMSDRGPIYIDQVLPGSPAQKAGLKKGDRLVSIAENDTTQISQVVAEDLLAGNAGVPVAFKVLRGEKQLSFSAKRVHEHFPDVTSKNLPNGLVYLRLDDFMDDHSIKEMESELKKHKLAKGFVVDVRDNPGGNVQNALQISSLFIKEGEFNISRERVDSDPTSPGYRTVKTQITSGGIEIDTTVDEVPDAKIDLHKRRPYLVGGKPVVVLVDEGTASAAEMFTGALKDNDAATVIGTKTFGKGIGQLVFPKAAGDAELKVTNFRYFTPSGAWIGDGQKNRVGITPNIVVALPVDATLGPDSHDDLQLQAAQQYLATKIQK